MSDLTPTACYGHVMALTGTADRPYIHNVNVNVNGKGRAGCPRQAFQLGSCHNDKVCVG
jgi:hypothetical protein